MVFSNSTTERSSFPERPPSGPGSFGAPPAAPRPTHAADDVEAPRIPVLGKTLLFRGELTAEEDVILQGRVEGSIRHARNLIIGTEGSVLGDVYAAHLTVEGLVEGDLHCSEAVIVRATAQVRGNIFAPRAEHLIDCGIRQRRVPSGGRWAGARRGTSAGGRGRAGTGRCR